MATYDLTVPAFMYALKAVRVGLFYGASIIASNAMEKSYIATVISKNEEAPALSRMLMILLAVDVGLNLALLALLFMVQMVLAVAAVAQGTSAFVSRNILVRHFQDYLASTLLIVAMGLLVIDVLSGNKYFRYRTEGVRAIRATRDLLFRINAILCVIPFYAIEIFESDDAST